MKFLYFFHYFFFMTLITLQMFQEISANNKYIIFQEGGIRTFLKNQGLDVNQIWMNIFDKTKNRDNCLTIINEVKQQKNLELFEEDIDQICQECGFKKDLDNLSNKIKKIFKNYTLKIKDKININIFNMQNLFKQDYFKEFALRKIESEFNLPIDQNEINFINKESDFFDFYNYIGEIISAYYSYDSWKQRFLNSSCDHHEFEPPYPILIIKDDEKWQGVYTILSFCRIPLNIFIECLDENEIFEKSSSIIKNIFLIILVISAKVVPVLNLKEQNQNLNVLELYNSPEALRQKCTKFYKKYHPDKETGNTKLFVAVKDKCDSLLKKKN